jgi:hypothetical protein
MNGKKGSFLLKARRYPCKTALSKRTPPVGASLTWRARQRIALMPPVLDLPHPR